MKSKAKYDWNVIGDVLSITDLNTGKNMSVTNDIENVVEEVITKNFKIGSGQQKVRAMPIIYRDSDGMWDGWNPATETFISLQKTDENEAKTAIKAYHKPNHQS